MRGFLDRLARKRAVVFWGPHDTCILRDGRRSDRLQQRHWSDFFGPEYLSYDELMISALCGISSPTHFINSGDRHNEGDVAANFGADDCDFPKQGVFMGLVGARFEKTGVMESALMDGGCEYGYGDYGGDRSHGVLANAEKSRKHFGAKRDQTILR